MEEFRGWKSCDWESFPRTKRGHDELVRRLKKIIRSEYGLRLVKFDRKEASVAERHGYKSHHYVAHEPDLVIADREGAENRIFVEYVNTLGNDLGNFIRDLRGMLSLSTIVKSYRGFVLAVRDSAFHASWCTNLPRDSPLEIMSLKSLLFALDKKDLAYLVGKSDLRGASGKKG